MFNKSADALRMAEILLNNSVNILEITLRNEFAFEAIKAVSERFPEMVTGAGSVLTKDALEKAQDNGAQFAVAPSFDPDIVKFSKKIDIPFAPGVSTPTELFMALKESTIIKIFPVAELGGVKYIKSIIAPFAMKEFSLIPTGGINETTYLEYLDLDRVIACGMSYVADKNLINKGDFDSLDKRIKLVYGNLF